MNYSKINNFNKYIGIYLHWPWCKKICPYCDFNVKKYKTINEKEWVNKYIQELKWFKSYFDEGEIRSIYFGGGTPSLMSYNSLYKIIDFILSYFKTYNNIEITIEANPSSLNKNRLKNFKSAGVNRLSVGIQSFREDELKFLGRDHSPKDAINCLLDSKSIFERANFDLIYGLPNQSLNSWKNSLNNSMEFAKNLGHISCYQLSIEKNTPFYKLQKNGNLSLPDENMLTDMYLLTSEICEKNGLSAYEISNHAIPGQESIHNLGYWKYNQYIGIGPGAHSRINKNRTRYSVEQIKSPNLWFRSIHKKGNGVNKLNRLNSDSISIEILLSSLRLSQGLNEDRFNFYTDKKLSDLITNPIILSLINDNFLSWNKNILKTNTSGRLVLDKIIEIFDSVLSEN
ncbi:radical SAM family heme chaperone HemW [Alphaproteobacteria bacterium]|nr:radical SAM family heme chaperone HemW [Alphaproteobacteria bacterium]